MQPIQQLLISEERIITPLVEVLNTVVPKPPASSVPALRQSLDELFPEQRYEEKDIQRTKETLGVIAEEFTPEQLKDLVMEIKYLTESWLDEFEREVFEGKTLNELLHEKGKL